MQSLRWSNFALLFCWLTIQDGVVATTEILCVVKLASDSATQAGLIVLLSLSLFRGKRTISEKLTDFMGIPIVIPESVQLVRYIHSQ